MADGEDAFSDDSMVVVGARHPIIERLLESPDATASSGVGIFGDGRGGGVAGAAAAVPNDIHVSVEGGDRGATIVTGPNMGGKSTYVRMVAVVAIMGQLGCYVPAQAAELVPFDAIYTRMGADDDLARGMSTFLSELHHTSQILRSATSRSLVILDELGRGTSTHDGVAIAKATLRYLANVAPSADADADDSMEPAEEKAASSVEMSSSSGSGDRAAAIKPAVLFVTHYPELAELASSASLSSSSSSGEDRPTSLKDSGPVVNIHMSFLVSSAEESDPVAVATVGAGASGGEQRRAWDVEKDDVTFLYRAADGHAGTSHGLNVARMAGLPTPVLQEAAAKAADAARTAATSDRAAEATALVHAATAATIASPPGGASSSPTAMNALHRRLIAAQKAARAGL